MNKIVITVPEEADGARADKFLAEAIDHLTRSALQKLISAGNVEIDGKVIAKSRVLKEGEDISVLIPDAVSLDVEAENIPIDIIFEDEDISEEDLARLKEADALEAALKCTILFNMLFEHISSFFSSI